MADLDSISAFLRVVETGSFTAAARRKGISLNSVSRKVMALERELGVQLIHRSTRHMSVTEAGQDYYDSCIQAEGILAQASQRAKALTIEPVGQLNILMPYALALSVVEPELMEFRRRHPRVTLNITLENRSFDLVEHGFDVALHRGPLPDSGYSFRRLARGGAHLVASPDYLEQRGRPQGPGELEGHDLLAHDLRGDQGGAQTVWHMRNPEGLSAEVTVRPVLSSNETMMLLGLVQRGAGIALLAPHVTGPAIDAGLLEAVLPGWRRSEDTDLVAVFPTRATNDRKVRLFIDFCQEIFPRIYG